MEHDVDQCRLCCGNLLEANIVENRVVLRCLNCGELWVRSSDGLLTSLRGADDSKSQHQSEGAEEDGDPS